MNFQNRAIHKTSRGASFAMYFIGGAPIFLIVEVIFQDNLINLGVVNNSILKIHCIRKYDWNYEIESLMKLIT